MPKIIQDSDIETIKKLLLNRNSYLDIKEILDNLEDVNSPKQSEGVSEVAGNSPSGDVTDILKDLKELLHKGKRSQIHKFEIRDIINKYGE